MSKPTFLSIVALLAAVALVTGFTPTPQYGQAAVLINDTIFVCGGYRQIGSQFVAVSNLYSLNVSQPWTSTSPPWVNLTNSTTGSSTVPSSGFYALWPSADNKSFYVWGGGNNLSLPLLQNGFAQYNVVTKAWSLPTTVTNMPLQRELLSASWTPSGVAYMWGGLGDQFSAYSSDLTAQHVFDDMITFDTKNLVWNVLNIFEKPTPRDAYTVTMLRNGQMVFIGGYILKQISITSVSKDYAPLNDIHIFDTNSAIWKEINATGVIPAGRVLHTAVLGIDDISVIICCGRNETSSFNDVAVLDTQNWYWTKPDVVGNAPSPRWGLSSVIVNGQMIVFFGIEDLNKTENDVGILDTKTIPFRWITGFSPSPPSPSSSDIPDGPAFSGGLITIIAVICGVLVVVTAALIFVIIRKPWQKNAKTESPRGPDDVSQQIQPADPHILLPVKP